MSLQDAVAQRRSDL